MTVLHNKNGRCLRTNSFHALISLDKMNVNKIIFSEKASVKVFPA